MGKEGLDALRQEEKSQGKGERLTGRNNPTSACRGRPAPWPEATSS